MKIFAIRDESSENLKDLGYLFYYEIEKLFYIELPENADPWETPLILDSFVKRNEKTINSYWSKIWVEQRIIPRDRQNLGMILRDNHLKEYDEFQLLTLATGRCAQDDFYLEPIEQDDLPQEIKNRFNTKIEEILPLDDYRVLVFFKNNISKICDLRSYFESHEKFNILLKKPEYFDKMEIMIGGYGIAWDIDIAILDHVLFNNGSDIPLSLIDFKNFVQQRVVNITEATTLLNCTRQNLSDLTKRKKLHPIKSSKKNTLFLKSDILKRNWQ